MTGRGARVKPTHTIESIIVSDASRPEDIQQSMHWACIKDVLFADSKPEVYEFSMARCLAFAARKVPASTTTERVGPSSLLKMFLNGTWPARRVTEINSLFHAYVKSGIIDVESPMLQPYRTGSVELPPLQLAVHSYCNLDAMVALLECGADETKVPKGDFQAKDDGPILAQAGDFLEFTKYRGPEFFSQAKAAIMRRVISTSVFESPTKGPGPAVRRRTPGV